MRNWLQRHFIPHETNDFKPHALQTTALCGMMILVLLSFALANFQSVLWIGSSWLVSTVLPAVVIDDTNIARADASLSSLRHSEVLDQVATLKAEDMAKNGYFAHWSPDGISPWHWFETAGYSYSHAGENLAVHFTDSDKVVEAWLESPTHRANIMNSNYTEIGIGTAKGTFEGYDTVFVVQVFGSPAAVAPDKNRASNNLGDEVSSDLPGEVAAAGEPTIAGVESDNQVDESTISEESVSMTDDSTVVRESFAATEVAQMVDSENNVGEETVSKFSKLLTSPRVLLQIVYSVIGFFVLVVLLIAAVLEWRRHHPVQLAYSVGMLAVMIALFQLHLAISNGVLIA